jgi:hypothetical protein
MAVRCTCWCHAEARGNYNDAAQRQDYPAIVILSRVETVNVRVPVESDDALEAAVASGCDCLNNHCPALSSLLPPRTLSEWKDPGFPPPGEAVTDTDDNN